MKKGLCFTLANNFKHEQVTIHSENSGPLDELTSNVCFQNRIDPETDKMIKT